MIAYKVTGQYLKGGEFLVGTFQTIDDAKELIQSKIEADRLLNSIVVYRLYHGPEVLKEFSTQTAPTQNQSSSTESSASTGTQKTSSFSFKPTPLNTTPRPPGMPPRWLVDDEEEQK